LTLNVRLKLNIKESGGFVMWKLIGAGCTILRVIAFRKLAAYQIRYNQEPRIKTKC